jgi:hypothetical protein
MPAEPIRRATTVGLGPDVGLAACSTGHDKSPMIPEGSTGQTWPKPPGSSSLLVIQVHGSIIATRENRVANSKIFINQWRNGPSSRNQLSHQLAFTKSAQEPEQVDNAVRSHQVKVCTNLCQPLVPSKDYVDTAERRVVGIHCMSNWSRVAAHSSRRCSAPSYRTSCFGSRAQS